MYGTSEGDIREVVRSTVICAASANVEVSAQVSLEDFRAIQVQNPHGIRRGAKNLVWSIGTYDAPLDHSGGVGFVITLITGEQVRFVAKGSAPVAGGSSFNVANALLDFDIKDVGIVSAVGDDTHGRHIIATLQERGLRRMTLFKREATASSLILREPDGTATLLACKPPYHPTDSELRLLHSACQTAVLVVTGVRSADLPLVEALWNTPSQPTRVFSPHISLVSGSKEERARCLDFCRVADLVHMNDNEAAYLFQLQGEDGRIVLPENDTQVEQIMQELVAPLESRIFCITRGARGSITYDGKRNRIIIQSAEDEVSAGNRVGAGDVHLAALVYYLRRRGRTIGLRAALEVASKVTMAKIRADDQRPWAGIPDSATRKPWVREAEARHSARNSGSYPAAK